MFEIIIDKKDLTLNMNDPECVSAYNSSGMISALRKRKRTE